MSKKIASAVRWGKRSGECRTTQNPLDNNGTAFADPLWPETLAPSPLNATFLPWSGSDSRNREAEFLR